MKGADVILKYRLAGVTPSKVRVVDGPVLGDSSPSICGAFEVVVAKSEKVEMLDMRWAHGLDVDVYVQDHALAKKLFDALVSVKVGKAFAHGYDATVPALKTYRIEAGAIQTNVVKG